MSKQKKSKQRNSPNVTTLYMILHQELDAHTERGAVLACSAVVDCALGQLLRARLCFKTISTGIHQDSQASVDEGHFEHSGKILGGLFKPREDASAFFQPSDQSFNDIPLAV